MGNRICCCCSSQHHAAPGLKSHTDGTIYIINLCSVELIFYAVGKVHGGFNSDPRYTLGPPERHGVDFIRINQTPTRPHHTTGPIVIAIYSYSARDFEDVSFQKGDRMEVLDDSDADWLTVLHLTTRKQGLVPRNFVALEKSMESEE